jgi:hypothetical protein
MNVICPDCRAYHWSAEKLSKSTIANPKFGTCCFSRKVLPGHLEDIPIDLHHLYFGTDNQSKKFLEHIRRYNNALAFTSVGQDAYKRLQTDNSVNDGHGPWLYKIKSELHHVTGTLLPSPGQTPMYSQLYIHDPDTALNHRMANRSNLTLDRGTMQTLQDMLYRQAYEITRDVPQDQDCTISLRFDSACV